MLQDFRFGLKLLWKEKAFTITALLTLALCIGANTAIFTVLRTVVLEPLAFAAPDRLVSVFNIYPGIEVTENGSNAVPDYFDRRQLTEIFDSVTLTRGNGFDLGSEGSPVHLEAQSVTPSFFPRSARLAGSGPRFHRRRRGLQEGPVRHPQLRVVER
jgi:hypothetical protein